ncbi:hypothetical protein KKA47_03585, partial [bacterium]|nr:hypothetical protein [bacterium]
TNIAKDDVGLADYKQTLIDGLSKDLHRVELAIKYLESYRTLVGSCLIGEIQNNKLAFWPQVYPKLNETWNYAEGAHAFISSVNDRTTTLSNFEPAEIRVAPLGSGNFESESKMRDKVQAEADKLQSRINSLHESRVALSKKYYDKETGPQKKLNDINIVHLMWLLNAGRVIMNLSGETRQTNIDRILWVVNNRAKIARLPKLEQITKFEVKLPYPPESFIGKVMHEKKKDKVKKPGNEREWKSMLAANEKYLQTLKWLVYDAAILQINQVKAGIESVKLHYYYTEKLTYFLMHTSD